MDGLFLENGPLRINPETLNLTINPYSWVCKKKNQKKKIAKKKLTFKKKQKKFRQITLLLFILINQQELDYLLPIILMQPIKIL